MAATTEGLSAEAAVRTLADLDTYEETLTARAGGLTWMVWGLAASAIFMTYNAAELLALEGPQNWLLAFLWLPWVVGATMVTNGLWRVQSVRMRSDLSGGKGWLVSLGFTALFFGVWALLELALRLDLSQNALMTVVVGVFTMALSTIQSFAKWCPPGPGLLAGAFILGVGVVLGATGLAAAAAGYVGAFSVLVSYFVLGGWFFRRG